MNRDQLLEAYRRMQTIRIAEEMIAQDFRDNKIFSFYHSSAGQEGVCVGVSMALQPGDKVFGNHRSHGHYLAQGGDLYRMFCEIYGKADGCCKGYGGSMHMLDRSVGFMGSTPILGSIAPIATGCAFAQKTRGERNITVVYVGDGASEEGAFYESLNLAALFKLPIIFVVENNLYAVNSPQRARRSSHFSMRSVAGGLGCSYNLVFANDVSMVMAYASDERNRLLMTKDKPSVLQLMTTRNMAHSGPITDESVRVIDSVEYRGTMDPIRNAEMQLLKFPAPADSYAFPEIKAEIHAFVMQEFARAKAAEDAVPVGVFHECLKS